MLKNVKSMVVGLGALSGVALGTVPDANAVEAYLTVAPATQWIQPAGGCVVADYAGEVYLNNPSMCYATAQLGSYTTSYFSVPWAPNPGSTVSVNWYASQPANSTVRGRLYSRLPDLTLYASSGWVYGNGTQGTFVAAGGGLVILKVDMAATVSNVQPALTMISGQVYSS
jgi:hypothetical protein